MTGPQDLATVENVPHGRTARRLEWAHLPPPVRRLVESRLGSPVAKAETQGGGFTPGFASRLTGENGSRMFVKAASKKAQQQFAASYAEEVRKLGMLPVGLPVPRLLWSHEDDLWIVLGFECVDGRPPKRPWKETELDACLDTLETLAGALTPAPAAMRLKPMTDADEFGAMLTGWDHVARHEPDWPHRAEAAALAARHREALAGDALVHTDARDDNFLLSADRGAVLCDWNWPSLGPAWADSVLLLISAYGDGIDADAHLARRALTKDVDPDHVDVLLALVCGYFLERRDHPVPPSSPFVRTHQAWYANATWAWLSARRGWS